MLDNGVGVGVEAAHGEWLTDWLTEWSQVWSADVQQWANALLSVTRGGP